MSEEREYILGTGQAELERLRFQHQTWVKEAYALWERAGFRAGDVLVDLGCGPGYTSLELAHVVGPQGRVIARDQSERFIVTLERECARLGARQIEPSLGPVEDLDLPREHLDGAYGRWLLSWVQDPGHVLTRVAPSLKRGAAIVLQEYLDWSAMKLIPRSAIFERAVAACMESWRSGGATIDLCDLVPELAVRAGLRVEHFRPIARLGGVGSLEWRWLGEFYGIYLPLLVERGLYSQADLSAFRAHWDERTAEGQSYCTTPTLADVILRKR